VGVKIGPKEVCPAQDIRILGVRVDSALKWKAKLRAVEVHTIRMLSALQLITGHHMGLRNRSAPSNIRLNDMTSDGIRCECIVHTGGYQECPKRFASKLKSLQGKCLRVVAGAYKATSTEALEVETHTQPIDIAPEGRVVRTMLHMGASHARHVADKETKKIQQQMRSKRGRQVRVRKALWQSGERWMRQIGKKKAYEKEDQEERPLGRAGHA
jgi:hypothetical protein